MIPLVNLPAAPCLGTLTGLHPSVEYLGHTDLSCRKWSHRWYRERSAMTLDNHPSHWRLVVLSLANHAEATQWSTSIGRHTTRSPRPCWTDWRNATMESRSRVDKLGAFYFLWPPRMATSCGHLPVVQDLWNGSLCSPEGNHQGCPLRDHHSVARTRDAMPKHTRHARDARDGSWNMDLKSSKWYHESSFNIVKWARCWAKILGMTWRLERINKPNRSTMWVVFKTPCHLFICFPQCIQRKGCTGQDNLDQAVHIITSQPSTIIYQIHSHVCCLFAASLSSYY